MIEVAFRPGVTDVPRLNSLRGMVEDRPALRGGDRHPLRTDGRSRPTTHAVGTPVALQHHRAALRHRFGSPSISARTLAGDRVERPSPSAGWTMPNCFAMSKARLLSLDLAGDAHDPALLRQPGPRRHRRRTGNAGADVVWHCVHKTFKAHIDFTWRNADGSVRREELSTAFIHQYLRAATDAVWPELLRSAFWTTPASSPSTMSMTYSRSRRTTTRRRWSPLAAPTPAWAASCARHRRLSLPIATTDVLCWPAGFPPSTRCRGCSTRRIADGVVAGVGDYGNKLGLPTVNGAVIYDEGYLGNLARLLRLR